MNTTRIAIVGVATLIAAFILWNWSQREAFASNLAGAVATATEQPVVFSKLTDFAWNRVALFGPYTDQNTVREALGFDWPGFERYGLNSADSFSLAVFVADDDVTRAVEIERCSPDFGRQLLGKSIPIEDASFRVVSSNGCATLQPMTTPLAVRGHRHLRHVF